MDWFEQTFGHCPHQGIRPYCPQCAGDRLREKAEARRAKEEKEHGKKLRKTVERQSAALDASYAHVRALDHRLQQERRRRMAAEAKAAKKSLLGRFRRG
jgi:hypothetical protein